MSENMKKVVFRTIGILMIILPINTLLYLLFPNALQYNEDIVLMTFLYVPITIGYVLYIINIKKDCKAQKVLIIISTITMIISFLAVKGLLSMEHTGIDYIGEALLYSMIHRVSILIARVLAFVIIIIDNKNFIFKKKTILVSLSIILVLGVLIFIFNIINTNVTTTKADENILTLLDFKKELEDRGLIINDYDTKIYGVKKGNNKAIELIFGKNDNEQYPLYVYSEYKPKYESSNKKRVRWIIYYINGEIYAVPGEYWHNNREEKIIWDYPNTIISESDEVTVYNMGGNNYKKGNTIVPSGFNYYSKNGKEKSVFVDIPQIVNWDKDMCAKIVTVNKINKMTLNEFESSY